nr:hypothetical protein [Tanacetum cinerariifolium]
MTNQSASRPAAASQGGGMGRRVDRGGGRTRGRSGDQGDGDVSKGCTYKKFLACNPKEYDGKGGVIVYTRWIKKMESVQDMSSNGAKDYPKAVHIADTLTDEALRNGSVKKNLKKRGNKGEPIKDRNVRDDNKRTRTENAFATTTNLAFMLGADEALQDPNIVMGIEPSDLGFCYEIEIASGGSFDVIIRMDWLSDYKAKIICHEKVVRIPQLDGNVLRVLGEKPKEKVRQLMSDKAKGKKQEEVVVVKDFPEVFLNDLSGLTPVWEIEFQIELVPRAMLVAKYPYRLAPSELEELSGCMIYHISMPPKMTNQSASRPVAASQGGGMGRQVDRGGGRTRGRSGDQGDGRIDCQGRQVGGQGSEVNDGVNEVPDFSTIIAQQLQNFLPTIVAQVGDQGIVVATEPKTIQKAVHIADTLTDEALRNGSVKKNLKKRGNKGEPIKDRNVRDDNKRTRTENAFTTTTNPIGRENMGTILKCTTYNTHHPPEAPCRICFNCNRPGHFAKDCRVVPRNVKPINAKNPTVRACYECGSTDHVKSACPRLNQAQGPRGNRPNQVLANNGGIEPSDLGFCYEIEIASGGSFDVIIGMDWLSDYKAKIICHEKVVRIPWLDGKVLRVLGEKPKEKVRQLMSDKAKGKKQEEVVVVKDFPEVFLNDLSRLTPVWEIEFQIELVPGAMLVAKYPYRLAPSELEELSGQLKELYDKVSWTWINGGGFHVDPSKIKVVKNSKAPRTLSEENAFQTLKDTLCNAPVLALPDRPNDFVVPFKGDVRTLIMDEAYKSKYFVHSGADKMYYNLRDKYLWSGIKKDIAVYVSKCLTCLKVKAEHQRPPGLLQQPEIPECKWEGIAIDFVTKLPRTSSGYDTIWVIVDRLTKSAHFLPMHEDYKMDRLARLYLIKIVAMIGKENAFQTLKDKLCNAPVLALPDRPNDFVVPSKGDVRTLIMDEAYKSKYFVHSGADKMYYNLRDRYLWSGIKKDITVYVSKCLTCLKVKAEHQRPPGLLQQPEIPECKWEGIAIDFVTKLPKTSSGYDTIWVIVDRLTKSAHFLPMHEDYKMDRLARLYLIKIVATHGVSVLMISDRDSWFMLRFWQSMQEALGTRLDISMAYHP